MHPEQQYLDLVRNVLYTGRDKPVFNQEKFIRSKIGAQIRFDLSDGSIPVVTAKKTFFRGAVQEMLWFLEGTADVAKLHRKNVFIWDDWAHAHSGSKDDLKAFAAIYLEPEDASYVVPVHYTNMTNYQSCNGTSINQIDWAVQEFKKRPFRKSYLVDCWRPDETYQMADMAGRPSVVLPACHVNHSILLDGDRLTLHMLQRSWDMFLGAPFNIAQYAVLQRMYCFLTGFPPGDLIISAIDYHLYSNQFDQAEEMLSRSPFEFPKLEIEDRNQKSIKDFDYSDFVLSGYQSHPPLQADVVVVGGYAEW
jgi:thymidylate synthase